MGLDQTFRARSIPCRHKFTESNTRSSGIA